MSTRDHDGVLKIYAGLTKILFPGGDATADEEAEILEFALEMRKRVKDQIYRIDETFERVDFAYRRIGSKWKRFCFIEITDPYVRTFHQCRNLMEVMETVLRHFDYSVPTVAVHLVTSPDEHDVARQQDYLRQIAEAMAPQGLDFTWDIDESGTIHARHFVIDDEGTFCLIADWISGNVSTAATLLPSKSSCLRCVA